MCLFCEVSMSKSRSVRRSNSKLPKTAVQRLPRIRVAAPRTAREFFALPERQQQLFEHVARVVSRMRGERVSLQRAARDAGQSRETTIRLAGSALRRDRQGRYVATNHDRLLRVLVV